MRYVTVFDASLLPYRNLVFALPGVGIAVVGALMLFRPEILERVGFRTAKSHVLGWVVFIFASLWTVLVAVALVSDARRASTGACDLVEGRVDHFRPMPPSGHGSEQFEVNGMAFRYADGMVSAGFHTTSARGGPIREGLPVRICHVRGEILRLEIAE